MKVGSTFFAWGVMPSLTQSDGNRKLVTNLGLVSSLMTNVLNEDDPQSEHYDDPAYMVPALYNVCAEWDEELDASDPTGDAGAGQRTLANPAQQQLGGTGVPSIVNPVKIFWIVFNRHLDKSLWSHLADLVLIASNFGWSDQKEKLSASYCH